MPYITFPSGEVSFSDVSDVDVNWTAMDFIALLSHMLYPSNEQDEQGEQFIQSIIALGGKSFIAAASNHFGAKKVMVEPSVALHLADAPRFEEVFASPDIQKAALWGEVSGFILGYTIFGNKNSGEGSFVSRADAYDMVSEGFRSMGDPKWGKEKISRHVWGGYESVAHLWAALQIMQDRGSDFGSIMSDEGFEQFLRISEWMRMEGERLRPGNAPVTVLDSNKTWKINPDVVMAWEPIDIQCSDLGAWDLRKRRPRALPA